ncbi:P-loop containing nucleoside triphosphate hydrolase protein [Aspergillus sclerotioniger CBS 115572]|uniref:P-loop containing nucleoside triphosphate hydrolase protein n=1 Tax=Aspergillus sclerotioniger CBS 115572 TaxID=1450535 RepID=A0A317XC46_9EURO|nr:P-loop containing nucleoside triphosphate hydrolase protein [Aspergillus sclerotioniger CBS 115572]PWY95905.1 P-loop containing nucleoside triphosphate hydrolase protein [Aspergillus sclerotioniger CBS 115572]
MRSDINEMDPPSKEYALPGSICKVHNLYQTKPDERGKRSWTKDLPTDLVEPAESTETGQYSLIVRHVKCYDGRKPLKVHSIIIQNKATKEFLANVLEEFPSLTMTLERVEFEAPFRPFVHRWTQFCTAREQEPDPTTKANIDLLYEILVEELGETITRKDDLISNGVMTHDLLWSIFEPGDIIFSILNGSPRAFILDSSEHTDEEFKITSRYIDFGGSNFGFVCQTFKIPNYNGTLPILALPVFPLSSHPNPTSIREELATRGRLWEGYKGSHYKHYEGIASGYFLCREMKYHINGRIVIDALSYSSFNPDEAIRLNGPMMKELSGDNHLITTPVLRGYSLKDKKWLVFNVDKVKEIVWNSRAFDSLVLPSRREGLKELILSFARAQSQSDNDFDDVIQGKGRGVIVLLSGPPGVGKTLTAESVAEVMKVPLYALSAGDLGTEPTEMEERLKDILEMVPRWGAVLLLDEADVFLEARNSTDLARNELVSIFLRLLEYYEGILFLTSNRAENIDPAFESRIHVSLRYPELNLSSRRQIWSQFLGKDLDAFTGDELDSLARVPLNGRQIKNVLLTAHLLARERGARLGYEQVETVLRLREPDAVTCDVDQED